MSVALTTIEELGELVGAVEHSGADAEESDAPGFTGAKKGDAGNA
jgi:hypothetical protein